MDHRRPPKIFYVKVVFRSAGSICPSSVHVLHIYTWRTKPLPFLTFHQPFILSFHTFLLEQRGRDVPRQTAPKTFVRNGMLKERSQVK